MKKFPPLPRSWTGLTAAWHPGQALGAGLGLSSSAFTASRAKNCWKKRHTDVPGTNIQGLRELLSRGGEPAEGEQDSDVFSLQDSASRRLTAHASGSVAEADKFIQAFNDSSQLTLQISSTEKSSGTFKTLQGGKCLSSGNSPSKVRLFLFEMWAVGTAFSLHFSGRGVAILRTFYPPAPEQVMFKALWLSLTKLYIG